MYSSPLDLSAFPTRRSSALVSRAPSSCFPRALELLLCWPERSSERRFPPSVPAGGVGSVNCTAVVGSGSPDGRPRSEEHTSELQSRGHLVCRLLLVKKISIH